MYLRLLTCQLKTLSPTSKLVSTIGPRHNLVGKVINLLMTSFLLYNHSLTTPPNSGTRGLIKVNVGEKAIRTRATTKRTEGRKRFKTTTAGKVNPR